MALAQDAAAVTGELSGADGADGEETGREEVSGAPTGDGAVSRNDSGAPVYSLLESPSDGRPPHCPRVGEEAMRTEPTKNGVPTNTTAGSAATEVTQPTAGSAATKVTQPTAGSAATEVTQPTAGSAATEVTQPTAGSAATEVIQTIAGSAATEVTKPTAGSAATEVTKPTSGSSDTDVTIPNADTAATHVIKTTVGSAATDVTKPTAGSAATDVTKPTAGSAATDVTQPTAGSAATDVTQPTAGSAATDVTQPTAGSATTDVTQPTAGSADTDVTKITPGSPDPDVTYCIAGSVDTDVMKSKPGNKSVMTTKPTSIEPPAEPTKTALDKELEALLSFGSADPPPHDVLMIQSEPSGTIDIVKADPILEDSSVTDGKGPPPTLQPATTWTSANLREFKHRMANEKHGLLTVRRGEVVTVRVPTHPDGKRLCWEFATDDYDIGFGIYFDWTSVTSTAVTLQVSESSDDEEEEETESPWHSREGDVERGSVYRLRSRYGEIMQVYRRDSHREVQAGSHEYPGEGVYLLKLDNSYSLLRSKTLYFHVYYSS
ncbi:protein TMED8 isoform X1 [Dendropsophus ebraccatus]|uniref:protein TMED8 isoform X1 n=1 Tax=Dendropsophus ebraccatus TaxID=150705 RepID=UPI003831F0F6